MKAVLIESIKLTEERGSDPNSKRYEISFCFSELPEKAALAMLFIKTDKEYKQGSNTIKDGRTTVDAWIHKSNKLNDAYFIFYDNKGNRVGKSNWFKIIRPD